MANWSVLKAAIADIIKPNDNKEITGQLLQNVLNNIITNLGENATFIGEAAPITNPGTPDGNVFYLAQTKGIYPNFNGIEVVSSPKILMWKGGPNWYAIDLLIYTKDYINQLFAEINNRISEIGEYIPCEEYIRVYTDENNKIVWGITRKGQIYIPFKYMLEEMHSHEGYLELTLDSDGKIVSYREANGVLHENSLHIEKHLSLGQQAMLSLKDVFESSGLINAKNPLDFSNANSLHIQMPSFGYVNISGISSMPTTKTDNMKAVFEFWDMNGSYFKKNVILNAQGSSSMSYPKKNFAVDMCNDNWIGDDTFSLKIGNWVPQDSFHFKAYYTDAFRGVGVICYKINEQIMGTRNYADNRPYKYLFSGSYKNYSDGTNTISDVNKNFDSGARCFPDGFPVSVYLNGEFYGIFSWQLKKHRDNYWMDKKNPLNIHLDGTLSDITLWKGTIDWTAFEIRNPKNLISINGGKYDGDNPTEIIGSDSPIYDASNEDHVLTATVKEKIIQLSQAINGLETYVEGEVSDDIIKAEIEKTFNVSFLIDYILMSQLVNNGDGFAKNWQWTTWDGVKWVANLYDADGAFGADHIGIDINPPSYGKIGSSLSIPTGWVWKYYYGDIKERYAELRNKKVFSLSNISSIIMAWRDSIGPELFKKEFEKWNQTPAYRKSYLNSLNWKPIRYIGNQMSYDNDKTYSVGDTCVYGFSYFTYEFQCINSCTGIPPVSEFYSEYPFMLGHYDSIYRLLNWIETQISLIDAALTYNN